VTAKVGKIIQHRLAPGTTVAQIKSAAAGSVRRILSKDQAHCIVV